MNTLEELIYYCKESQPMGAIMLTGEWGCGKTYLVDNALKSALLYTHVILRVSLFGLDSADAVRKEVKRSWLYALAEVNEPVKGMSDVTQKVSSLAGKFVGVLPEPIKTLASDVVFIDALELVKIQPVIANIADGTKKTVVLVFDDLERSNIQTCDLLGCINDYCENLHIHIIVIANEAKINGKIKSNNGRVNDKSNSENNNDKSPYDEIKEKIIQRTISFKPDYEEVISNVIDSMVVKEGDTTETAYKNFIVKNKNSISLIFYGSWMDGVSSEQLVSRKNSRCSEDRSQLAKSSQTNRYGKSREEHNKKIQEGLQLLKKRPHNIRSLKFALRDFARIYSLLMEKQIDNVEKWLFSYLSYVLAYRAGLVSNDSGVGSLLSEDNVSKLYAGFYSNLFITNGIKQWVKHGEWNTDVLDSELKAYIDRNKAVTSEEKARTWEVLALEDEDVREGYPILLDRAYAGLIELNDYVNLLHNCCRAREYKIPIPEIDWNKIYEGLSLKMNKMVENQEARQTFRVVIDKENKNLYSGDEWHAWEMIDNFLSKNEFVFRKNKNSYLGLMKTAPMSALIETRNLQLEAFDPEMATVTADAFITLSNAEKGNFVESFRGMWHLNIEAQNCDIALSKKGFQILQQCLIEYLGNCREKKCTIAAVHTEKFIKAVEELMNDIVGE